MIHVRWWMGPHGERAEKVVDGHHQAGPPCQLAPGPAILDELTNRPNGKFSLAESIPRPQLHLFALPQSRVDKEILCHRG